MTKHLFHPSLYQFDQPQPSYWEATAGESVPGCEQLVGSDSCDVAIIGGGYTGLSAALHLARDYHVDVRVLEAGHIGWGASGRNGGFVVVGGTFLSLTQQFSKYGVEETRRYYQSQVDAVNLVRDLGADEQIDYLQQGDCEYEVADNGKHFQSMQREAEVKKNTLGLDVRIHSRDAFSEIGYNSEQQHGAIELRPSFALHPLKYAQGLARAVMRHGAKIHAHTEVIDWRKDAGTHVLTTATGELRAKRVILCGNGFMPEHLHSGIRARPAPVQSAIVVTRPLSDDELSAQGWRTECPMVNSANLYFYYRLLSDKRLMLGGRGDHTGTPAAAEKTHQFLQSSIGAFWPAFKGVEIAHKWRGLVCFTQSFRPSIGRMPDDKSVYFGFGYHGNGVNTATWAGRELACWLAGKMSGNEIVPKHLPAIVRGQTPRVPLAFLRKQYIRAGIAVWKLRDVLGL